MFPGVAPLATAGAGLVAYTGSFWPVTLGTFLVGLGWAAANVASTALIADHYVTATRGRALWLQRQPAPPAISVLVALLTGPMIWPHAGIGSPGLIAVLLAVPPLAMLIIGGSSKSLMDRSSGMARLRTSPAQNLRRERARRPPACSGSVPLSTKLTVSVPRRPADQGCRRR